MVNASLTRNRLDELASQVEPRDPADAVLLRDLGEGLAGGPSADAWAFSNLRAVLDPERISNVLAGDASADLLTRGLEFLRNSLVLLPLAITWFGIAIAVDAYYKLIGDHPELAGQSFIYLWQGGFQGHMLVPLPLFTLAILDAFLLAGVFGLTLAAYARSAWLSLVNGRFGAEFSRNLSEALAEAELALAPRRGAQYYTFLQGVDRNAQGLLKEIAEERERVGKMAQRREQELEDLDGITDNLKNSSVVFLNAAQSLGNTQTATLAAVNGVMGTVKGLAAAQQDVMKAVYHVAGRMEGYVPQITDRAVPDAKTPGSSSPPIPGMGASAARPESVSAGQAYSMLNLMVEQQRTLQETLAKIESVIATQRDGMEKLLAGPKTPSPAETLRKP